MPARAHLEAAAAWYVRLSAAQATPADRAGWQAWHDSAAEHRAAWQRVERLQSLLAQAPSQTAKALRGSAGVPRRRILTSLGLVAVAALLLPLVPPLVSSGATQWITTAPGERREVSLPDGGLLLIGAASRVGIRYGSSARDILIEAGAMSLRSGNDAEGRPLHILGRDGVLQPLGTRFTLQQDAAGSVLAVQEHAVELRPIGGGATVRVEAGQRLRFSGQAVGRPEPALFADVAWTQGILAVIDMPLGQFVEAMRRQAGIDVACEPGIAGLRVSGSFQVDQPQRSLAALAELQALRLEKRGEAWRLRPR